MYEALFLSHRPRTECSISQFCKTCCSHSIGTRGLLAKLFKQFSKSPIRPADSHFWQALNFQWQLLSVWMNMNRVTLQHNKEFIMFIFYLMVFSITRRLIRPSFWVLLRAVFMNDWKKKKPGTAIKIARETTNNQQKKYNSVKYLLRQVLLCL